MRSGPVPSPTSRRTRTSRNSTPTDATPAAGGEVSSSAKNGPQSSRTQITTDRRAPWRSSVRGIVGPYIVDGGEVGEAGDGEHRAEAGVGDQGEAVGVGEQDGEAGAVEVLHGGQVDHDGRGRAVQGVGEHARVAHVDLAADGQHGGAVRAPAGSDGKRCAHPAILTSMSTVV